MGCVGSEILLPFMAQTVLDLRSNILAFNMQSISFLISPTYSASSVLNLSLSVFIIVSIL